MRKREGIGKKIKRELMRAIFERSQGMDTSKMLKAMGAGEPVVYDDVEETLNVAYVNRSEVALAMDIFKPRTEEGKELPVILVIHGGGLIMGDRGLNRPYCRLLAHKGYLVFSLEYRLAPKATLSQQLDDVCAGMDQVGRMLVDYDVDFSRIFLVADSAGGYLAAYVSAMHGSEKLQRAIGYKASRMTYAAIGFICGMFYTNEELQDQIYGAKREDENFLKYMDIEHPEIVENLPPAFLLTSCGDGFNNYAFRFNKALKKNGKVSKLLYLGDEDLLHIFPILNSEHPRSLEATDKMLAWFEEKADIRREFYKKDPETEEERRRVEGRIADGSISRQKVWSNLRERIEFDKKLLEREAIIDCSREYTYEQMFARWESYARVFSALKIDRDHGSRAALCGVIAAEPVFALFGLNMTGAQVSLFSYEDFLPGGIWRPMLEEEKITDLIISDILVSGGMKGEIDKAAKDLGLRNVIYLHSPMGGPTTGPLELACNEFNHHMLRQMPDTHFMKDLLLKYKDEPVSYDRSAGEEIAFIVHTPGTRRGSKKALPLTDKAFNDTLNYVPQGYRAYVEEAEEGKHLRPLRPLRLLMSFDFSSFTALSGQMGMALASGDTLITTCFGYIHPKFFQAIDYYDINVLTLAGFIVDRWMERSDLDHADFSSLKLLGLRDGDIPPEKMDRYISFFRDHGYKYDIMTEVDRFTCGVLPQERENHPDGILFDLFNSRNPWDQGKNSPGSTGFRSWLMPWGSFLPGGQGMPWEKLLPGGQGMPWEKLLPGGQGMPWEKFLPAGQGDQDFSMPEIPEGVMKMMIEYSKWLAIFQNGRKTYNYDIEE